MYFLFFKKFTKKSGLLAKKPANPLIPTVSAWPLFKKKWAKAHFFGHKRKKHCKGKTLYTLKNPKKVGLAKTKVGRKWPKNP